MLMFNSLHAASTISVAVPDTRPPRSAAPNDQRSEFNFKRTSSVQIRLFAVNSAALDDTTSRLYSLVNVLESAEAKFTEVPAAAS